MSTWILILWMTCDSKGMININVKSKNQCINAGKQFKESKDGWTSCKHYQCLEIEE
jgi:hypothetical protein